jgi:hypothetical protein
MFGGEQIKRPGDATTSRGMAPKTGFGASPRYAPAQPLIRSGYACLNDRGMAMARVSMEVPSELVGPIRETVLLLYQATAESLQLSLRSHSEGRGSLEELAAHRARLAELDELAGSLGWRAGRPGRPAAAPPGSRQLSAPAELLHDAFYGALIDAGERLSTTVDRAWRGELPLKRVQEAAAEVLALHRLLRLLELRTGGAAYGN